MHNVFRRLEEETHGLEREREMKAVQDSDLDDVVQVSGDVADLQKVVEIIRSVGKAIEPLVQAAQEKVELKRYDVRLVFSREGSVVSLFSVLNVNGLTLCGCLDRTLSCSMMNDVLCTRGNLFMHLRSGVGGCIMWFFLTITVCLPIRIGQLG